MLYGPPATPTSIIFSYGHPQTGPTTSGVVANVDLNQPHGDYGGIIPLSMGHRRLSSQIIWATPITGSEAAGFFANFAVCWGLNGDTDPSATEYLKLWANGTKIWAGGTKLMPGGWDLTLYKGTESQAANSTIVAAGGAQTGYRGLLYGVFTNFPITRSWKYSIPGISAEVSGAVEDSDGAALDDGLTLRAFVERVGSYAGLDPAADMDFDAAISDTITGGVIASEVEFTDFGQNLGKWFGFDTFEGEAIEFIRPVSGSTYAVDLTVPATGLLNQTDRSLTTTRGEDDSPVVVQGKYIDQTQQFRFNTQRARRILFPTRASESRRHVEWTVPVVLSANQAVTYLGKAIYRMAGQNVLHEFQLPPRYLGIEPGDILSITAGDTVYVVKVQKIEIGADLSISVDAVNLYADEDIELEGESGTPLENDGGTSTGSFGTGPGTGSTWNFNSEQILLNRLTTPSDYAGAVQKLTVKVYSSTAAGTHVKGLIYALSGSDATALLGTSVEVTLTGSESTIDLEFTPPVTGLAASTAYGFGLISSGALYFGDMVETGNLLDSLGQDYDSPPTSLTLDDDGEVSFEMTVVYA